MELRPYQADAVQQARDNRRNDILRQIICLPTGAGKTETAILAWQGGRGHRFIPDAARGV